jgi:hypothetical protein
MAFEGNGVSRGQDRSISASSMSESHSSIAEEGGKVKNLSQLLLSNLSSSSVRGCKLPGAVALPGMPGPVLRPTAVKESKEYHQKQEVIEKDSDDQMDLSDVCATDALLSQLLGLTNDHEEDDEEDMDVEVKFALAKSTAGRIP